MDKTAPSLPRKLPRFRLQQVVGGLLFLLVVVGSGVAYYLSQQDQDIRQQAAGGGCLYTCKVEGGSDQECARKCDPAQQSGDSCPGSCQPGSCSVTDQIPTGTGRCGPGNSQYCCKPKPTPPQSTSPSSTPVSSALSSAEVVVGPNAGQCYCKNSSGQNYVCRDQTLCCANASTAALVTACKKPESTSGPEVVVGPNAQQCYCKNSQGLNYVCRDQTVCCSNPSFAPYVAACKNSQTSASKPSTSPSPSTVPVSQRIKNIANETLVGPSGSYCYCKDAQGFNYLCTNQALCCGNKAFATYMAVCQTNYVAPSVAPTKTPSPSPSASPKSSPNLVAESDPLIRLYGNQCFYNTSSCAAVGRKRASGCLACSAGICCGGTLEATSSVCGSNDVKTVTIDGKKMSCIKGELYPVVTEQTAKSTLATKPDLGITQSNGGGFNPNVAGFTQSGPSATAELRRIGCGPTNVTNALLRMGVKTLPNGKPLTPNNFVDHYFGSGSNGQYGSFYGTGGIPVDVAQKILAENGAKTQSLTASGNTNDTYIDIKNTQPNPQGSVREKQLAKIKEAIQNGHQVLVAGEFWAGGVKHVHYTTLTKVDANGNLYGYDTSIPTQNGGHYKSDTANLINYSQLDSSVIRQAVEIYQ